MIDTATRTVVATVTVGEGPLGIGVDPQDKNVYVADWYTHRIYVIDTASLKVKKEFRVGRSPSGIAFNRDGSRAYISRSEHQQSRGQYGFRDRYAQLQTDRAGASGQGAVRRDRIARR